LFLGRGGHIVVVVVWTTSLVLEWKFFGFCSVVYGNYLVRVFLGRDRLFFFSFFSFFFSSLLFHGYILLEIGGAFCTLPNGPALDSSGRMTS
jgi:hypothetical protein